MSLKELLREAAISWKGSVPAHLLPRWPAQSQIRRCIHQLFFSAAGNQPPPEIQRNIDQIRRLNPDWDYRLYDAEQMVDFISTHYGPRVLGYFERINPAFGAARADLFRYLLLYHSGGVYLDVKSTLTRPLNAVIRQEDCYLLSHWRNQPGEEFEGWGLHAQIGDGAGEFQQWHIAAAAGHPFLRAVIERVLRNIARYNPVLHGLGWLAVMCATGPIAYTLAIRPLLPLYPHRIVDAQQELGFQYSIYPSTRQDAHHALFRSHYSRLDEPIVQLTAADVLLSRSLVMAKRAKAGLLTAARSLASERAARQRPGASGGSARRRQP